MFLSLRVTILSFLSSLLRRAITKVTKSMLTSVAHSGPCGCAEKLPSDQVARECGLQNWWPEGKGKMPGTWYVRLIPRKA